VSDLELALSQLDVEWPETPDIAAAVAVRLEAPPKPRWRRRLAAAVAALALLFGGTMAVSPSARTDVLRWLGLKSVEIKKAPPPQPTPGAELNLGTPTTLAVLRDARIPVLVPRDLGAPGVYRTMLPEGSRAASLVFPGPILVQTFRATATPFIEKTVASSDQVERLRIDGAPAYFISGSHGFAYQTAPDQVGYEEQRIAGNTLLVERDGILLRIEGELTRQRAVEIAQSVQ
jgi:hypothetical protein